MSLRRDVAIALPFAYGVLSMGAACYEEFNDKLEAYAADNQHSGVPLSERVDQILLGGMGALCLAGSLLVTIKYPDYLPVDLPFQPELPFPEHDAIVVTLPSPRQLVPPGDVSRAA